MNGKLRTLVTSRCGCSAQPNLGLALGSVAVAGPEEELNSHNFCPCLLILASLLFGLAFNGSWTTLYLPNSLVGAGVLLYIWPPLVSKVSPSNLNKKRRYGPKWKPLTSEELKDHPSISIAEYQSSSHAALQWKCTLSHPIEGLGGTWLKARAGNVCSNSIFKRTISVARHRSAVNGC